MRSRSQKPISARIDYNVLKDLDEFCAIKAAKRNTVINRAIRDYLKLMETMTRCSMHRTDFISDSDFLEIVREIDTRRNIWWSM